MTRFVAGILAVVVASVAMLVWGLGKYGVFSLGSVDDADVSYRYRLVCGARADVEIDAARLPRDLQGLLPLARRYGHNNHLIAEDCARRMTSKEAAQVVWDIDQHRPAIDRWLAQSSHVQHVNEVSAFVALLRLRQLLRPASTHSESAG